MSLGPSIRVFALFPLVILFGVHALPQQKSAEESVGIGVHLINNRASYRTPDGSRTEELARGSVAIQYPAPKGPAQLMGVTNGDLVISINGKRVCEPAEFVRTVSSTPAGTSVQLRIFRAGSFQNTRVTLTSLSNIDPEAGRYSPVPIEAAAAANDYKTAHNLCKRISDDHQIETSMSCVDAFRFRYDQRGLRKAIDAHATRCNNCIGLLMRGHGPKRPRRRRELPQPMSSSE